MKYLRFILLFILALAISCAREPGVQHEIAVADAQGMKTIHMLVTASGAKQTRATVNGESQYIFESGDRLFVQETDSGDTLLFGILTMISGAGNTTALFEGDLYCNEEFDASSSTNIKVTLISSSDLIHTVEGGKVISTIYPANNSAQSLEEAIRKFSDFTCSSTLASRSFSLTQNSSFVSCNVAMSLEDMPANTQVETNLISGSNSLWSGTLTATESNGISVIGVVLAFPGDEIELETPELTIEWTDGSSVQQNRSFVDLADGTLLAANHHYTISRSSFVYSGFRIKPKYASTTITDFKYKDATVQFSLNAGATWSNCSELELPLTLNSGDSICFKGTRTDCNCNGTTQLFVANNVCYVAGDITSLLNYPNSLPQDAFRSLFSNGNNSNANPAAVTWVDIDPDDPLIFPNFTGANCYLEMFRACTNLTSAPELPATSLAGLCYSRMFHTCTSLDTIPALPASVSFEGDRCCYQMFQSCTAIDTLRTPLFGGTLSLRKGCFEDMFAHCTALRYVTPNFLPATTLAQDCYRGMFQDTGLVNAPELLVETLSWTDCYRFMFNACDDLQYVKCLAKNNSSGTYTSNWLNGTSTYGYVPNTSSCTFVKHPDASWPRSLSGIPSNWIVTDYVAPTP